MRRPALILIALAALLLLITTACYNAYSGPPVAAVSTPTQKPTFTNIAYTKSTSNLASLPPEKQTVETYYITARAGSAKYRQSPIPPTETPNFTPAPPKTGIIENDNAPFPSAYYRISNHWQDTFQGNWTQGYAGAALLEGEDQGFIAILMDTAPTGDPNRKVVGGEYMTPTKAGIVRITKVENSLVTLVAKDGTIFIFDLASRTFNLTAIATITPARPMTGADSEATKIALAAKQTLPTVDATRVAKYQNGTPLATPAPTASPRTGIIEGPQAPFGADKYIRPENVWQSYWNDHLIAVYAGHLRGEDGQNVNERQGVILVVTNPNDRAKSVAKAYLTPTISGSVRIISVVGNSVTIKSADGTVFTFDLASRSFVK